MEGQLQRSSHAHHHHEDDDGLHSEHHHHGEKKSVLKKVKDKAKKIKDTIKKHAHSHEHEHQGGLHSEDDEDPEVHGAPMHESTVVRSKNLQRGSNTDLDKGEQHVRDEGDGKDPHAPNNTPAKISSSNYDGKEAEVGRLNVNHQDQFVNPVSVSRDSTDETHDTIAEKISSATYAVADKAISAKNLVATKLGYSGGDQDSTSKVHGSEGGGDSSSSMKEYMCEKFRPGDEEKALSEAITDAFQQKKEAVWGAEEQEQPQQQQRGKVTLSKEVAERLGTARENKRENKREGEDALAAGVESSGQGVTERLKDAVGSWLGKSSGIQTAQDSVGNAFVNNAAGSAGGGGGGR